MKKKFTITIFFLFFCAGILFSHGDCEEYSHSKNHIKTKPEIIFVSKNLSLYRHFRFQGETIFTVKDLEGVILSENISRLKLLPDLLGIKSRNNSKKHPKLKYF